MSTTFNMTDYDKAYAEFRWDVPEKFNFAQDVIDKWANENPDLEALLWLDDDGNEIRKTYADISRESKQLANVLTKLGIKRGDVVVIMLSREVEWWTISTACLRMGAILSPGTSQMTSKDIEYRINRAEATCFITSEIYAERFEAVRDNCPTIVSSILIGSERDAWTNYATELANASEEFETADTAHDENAICYFTSGTTGYPKMTLHTHTSYPLGHLSTGRYWLDNRPGQLHWNISDTGWAQAAWSSFFGPWNMGATVFVHHTKSFSATGILDMLERYPINILCGPPTVYRMLVQEDLSGRTFDNLRYCIGAGEPLNPEVIETWQKATGLVIRDGYGQTETVLLCGSFACIEPRYGSMGKPAPGIDLQVIDHEGNVLPANQEGDIAVRVKPERPFRSDDVILSAGYRIGPFEVESALIEHAAVQESAVVASPDEVRGDVVKAFIVLAPNFEASDDIVKELQDHVKTTTAPYKYPRRIEFVDSLPKTISGKIRRIELREQETS